jgi:hypothetical protein
MITSSFDPWATIPDWCDEHEEMDVGGYLIGVSGVWHPVRQRSVMTCGYGHLPLDAMRGARASRHPAPTAFAKIRSRGDRSGRTED